MSVVHDYFRARIPEAASLELAFPWDQWRYTDYFLFDDDSSVAPFEALSPLACRGLVIASAEAITARFWAHSGTDETEAYLDAAWATMEREGTCDYAMLHPEDWPGPVKGALRAAMLVVNDTLYEARDDGDFAARCVWILQLAHHVMPSALFPDFSTWFHRSVERLARRWPVPSHESGLFAPAFDRGPLVGPCTFLPEDPGTPESAAACLSLHLAALGDNSWLTDPDDED
ncbi:hypothetical protein [Rhodobacter sp. NSM]|uniref:hypothetical protein n=1 Tax=Rhodobacter sp. NSM TaxID=3457501 RepID=UPI003FD04CCE